MAFNSTAVMMAGPAGQLQGVLEQPEGSESLGAAVILHPHPLMGGTMDNKVVVMTARALVQAGYAALRFNFRGVGHSVGSYADGVGEREDALAATTWLKEHYPGQPLCLAGFSFGAYVALLAADDSTCAHLITIAPPVQYPALKTLPRPRARWCLLQGEADEVVDCEEVLAWARAHKPPPTIRTFPGVSHFFHGALTTLQEAVRTCIQSC